MRILKSKSKNSVVLKLTNEEIREIRDNLLSYSGTNLTLRSELADGFEAIANNLPIPQKVPKPSTKETVTDLIHNLERAMREMYNTMGLKKVQIENTEAHKKAIQNYETAKEALLRRGRK